MPNRLAAATSPYLLQHAGNPVDWHEWGPEAFDLAIRRDQPVFLSVGYSACHWCHVMAHESFEDPTTAAYMNEHFVNVKVDREERPDVDRIYMDAVQAMTGQGGWPMSVFLTPDGRPILAGTYFPAADHPHRPSFRRVMEAIVSAWADRRGELVEQADRLTGAVRRLLPPAGSAPGRGTAREAADAMLGDVDPAHGGFGGAPKFPQAPNLELLLRLLAIEPDAPRAPALAAALRLTLDRMAAGGIYDQLGGGFARYSVDARWLVPHFEKMLYDNALLARVYLRAWQLLGNDDHRRVAVETLDYLLRDMTDPAGGLHSAEDADSEGEEGKYYVWDREEFYDVAGDGASAMAALYGVTGPGNFEGSNILHLATTPEQAAEAAGMELSEFRLLRARVDAALLAAREGRTRPGRDDKVITSWNGMALRALAEAGAILGSRRYLDAAAGVARFCLDQMTTPGGRLQRAGRDGRTSGPGYCDDYASLTVGLLTLYQAEGDTAWFDAALTLADDMIDLFADPGGPGFFATGRDAEALIARPKNYMDNPTPSDNSLAAEALQMLYALTGEGRFREHLDDVFVAAGTLMERYPAAVGHLLSVLAVDRPKELAVVGPPAHRVMLEGVVWETFRPDVVLASGSGDGDGGPPLLDGRPAGTAARAYVCRDFVCALPVETPAALRGLLGPETG